MADVLDPLTVNVHPMLLPPPAHTLSVLLPVLVRPTLTRTYRFLTVEREAVV